MRYHYKKPFTCLKCNRLFSVKSDLDEHSKLHDFQNNCSVDGNIGGEKYHATTGPENSKQQRTVFLQRV